MRALTTVVLTLALMLLAGFAQASNSNAPGKITMSPKASLPGTIDVTGTQTVGALGACSRVDIYVTGEITGTTDLGGGMDQIRISIWDDSIEEAFTIVSVPVGSTITINEHLGFEGQYATGMPGVGVYIYDGPTTGGSTLFSLDPFVPDDIPGSCAATATPTSVPALTGISLALLLMLFAGIGFRVVRR